MPLISAGGLFLQVIRSVLSLFYTPRSDIRIQQHVDDAGHITNDGQDVVANFDLTAVNDGPRDGQLAKPVLEEVVFESNQNTVRLSASEIGSGRVRLEYRQKEENKVVSESNDKIRIVHRLPARKGIHDYVSEHEAMNFRYTVMVEDGGTPYTIEAEATLDISGVTLRE